MKNKIILALSIFLLSSCGNLKELSSVDFLENYDKEILTLNLSNTQLEELPDFTQYATGEWVQEVETIDLSNNSILSIGSGALDIFTSLNSLNFDNNEFKSGSDVNIPKTIQKLSLSDNKLDNIDGFNKYTELRELNLNNNNLEDNNLSELGGFKYLGKLEVEGNNISQDLLDKINNINNK